MKKYNPKVPKHDVLGEQKCLMFEKQAGKCAICGEHTKLVVDHCHQSGEIRGLLCMRCNSGLGMFLDSIQLLNRAKNYLQASGSCRELQGKKEAPKERTNEELLARPFKCPTCKTPFNKPKIWSRRESAGLLSLIG